VVLLKKKIFFLIFFVSIAGYDCFAFDKTSPRKVPPLFAGVDISAALLGQFLAPEHMFETWALSINYGMKIKKIDLFTAVEYGRWGSYELGEDLVNHLLNVGIGIGFNFFKGRMRASFAAGPSVLLTDTMETKAGKTGFFIDLRPLGFRFPLGRWFIVFNAVTFSFVMPIVTGIPLIYMRYRTTLSAGFWF
jgi:hypothetical protein